MLHRELCICWIGRYSSVMSLSEQKCGAYYFWVPVLSMVAIIRHVFLVTLCSIPFCITVLTSSVGPSTTFQIVVGAVMASVVLLLIAVVVVVIVWLVLRHNRATVALQKGSRYKLITNKSSKISVYLLYLCITLQGSRTCKWIFRSVREDCQWIIIVIIQHDWLMCFRY